VQVIHVALSCGYSKFPIMKHGIRVDRDAFGPVDSTGRLSSAVDRPAGSWHVFPHPNLVYIDIHHAHAAIFAAGESEDLAVAKWR
jgi:hypothetical protein